MSGKSPGSAPPAAQPPPLPHKRSSGRPVDSGLLQRLVPDQNLPALLAYYAGVFAAVPPIGCLLGPAAFILGILGLDRAAARPEAKGKAHAWAGIVLGFVFGLGQALGVVYLVTHAGSFERLMEFLTGY